MAGPVDENGHAEVPIKLVGVYVRLAEDQYKQVED